jgi:putative endonuclease
MPDGQGRDGLGGRTDRRAEAGGLPTCPETRRKQLTGRTAYLSGQAAEDQVTAFLEKRGLVILARRWRGQAGEIDLICADGATTVFVEVKRAESFAAAAQSLLPRQIARIRAAASEFVASLPAGQDSDMRFDVALVDGLGRIEIIGNALGP